MFAKYLFNKYIKYATASPLGIARRTEYDWLEKGEKEQDS